MYSVLRYVFLTLALALHACSSNELSQEIVDLNDRGVAQMERYQYGEAFNTFSDVVAEQPSLTDGRINLAIATLNRQDPNDEYVALKQLEEILLRHPRNERALYTSGVINFYVGNVDRARELFEQVVELDPTDAYTHYFLGQIAVQEQRFSDALETLDRVIELDEYLTSAYWAGYLAATRLGMDDRAQSYLTVFQKFETNPVARTVDISYKKMGPKAEAIAIGSSPSPAVATQLDHDIFDSYEDLDATSAGGALSIADLNSDGLFDVIHFALDEATVRYQNESGFGAREQLPFSVEDEVFPLWGDMNNDGLLDVVLCGSSGVSLHGGTAIGEWSQSRQLTDNPCNTAVLLDADHDGDLDLIFSGADGSQLLNNNRDGTYRDISTRLNIEHSGPATQIIAEDFDSDRDLDILFLFATASNVLLENDRTWEYREFEGDALIVSTRLIAAAAADTNSNGVPEVIGAKLDGSFLVSELVGGEWIETTFPALSVDDSAVVPHELAITEFNGDQALDLLLVSDRLAIVVNPADFSVIDKVHAADLQTVIPHYSSADSGASLIGLCCEGMRYWRNRASQSNFFGLSLSGINSSNKVRSNASGIGAKVSSRVAGRWTTQRLLDTHSGSAQSLMPMTFGLGGRNETNFILIEWSDGVSQSEIGLEKSKTHHIVEENREIASCPIVFAWNGSSYEFVSDVLGVAALGLFKAPGELVPVRNFERLLLTSDQLSAEHGKYKVKLAEPMEEIVYLDAMKLFVVDVETTKTLVLDERYATAEPSPTGRVIKLSTLRVPDHATDRNGQDVTESIVERDETPLDPGEIDSRFVGLLRQEQLLTMYFDEPLPSQKQILIADGWMQYPYSQTSFSSWQTTVEFNPPTLSARGGDGEWQVVAENFGFPAGTPRRMALPLPTLPEGTNAVALAFNMEIYWDHVAIATESDDSEVFEHVINPDVAKVRRVGFAKRNVAENNRPYYDYNNRSAYWDSKIATGFYTKFGNVVPLVTQQDGGVSIVGAGEELHLEFEAIDDPPEGFDRYFVLEFRGWAKDMDLYTREGETVEPLPVLESTNQLLHSRGIELNDLFNVRFRTGM